MLNAMKNIYHRFIGEGEVSWHERPMLFIRRVLNFVIAGALLGVLLVSYVGPPYIKWDSSGSGAGVDARCLCAETARQGADKIIAYQMNGLAAGAVGGMLIGMLWAFMRRGKGGKAPVESTPKA
jgi:hypothetical protein